MVDFTVAIPTYNGETRLPKLLDQLRSQINTEHFSWEIFVVDNNSIDNTAKVVQEYQKNWPQPYPLKYYFEAEQGAAFARQQALHEAKSELVGFLDDDNLPAPDWVAEAYSFGKVHPQAGAYGGQIHGEFELPPPEDIKKIQGYLSIRERGSKANLYEPHHLILPPSAAVVVRKQAWYESVPKHLVFKGRVGQSMVGGEDLEVVLHMHKASWEIWYNPAMHTYHQIPQWRLEREYLLSLAHGCGLCTCELRMITTSNWQKPIVITKIFLGNLRRMILQFLKYRRKMNTDLAAACEVEFFRGSLMSTIHYLGKNIQTKFLVKNTP